MTRTKTPAPATTRRDERTSRERARRTHAAARLQVCANVFARSRIHFDPGRRDTGGSGATDRVNAPAIADAGDGGDDDSITIH